MTSERSEKNTCCWFSHRFARFQVRIQFSCISVQRIEWFPVWTIFVSSFSSKMQCLCVAKQYIRSSPATIIQWSVHIAIVQTENPRWKIVIIITFIHRSEFFFFTYKMQQIRSIWWFQIERDVEIDIHRIKLCALRARNRPMLKWTFFFLCLVLFRLCIVVNVCNFSSS